MGTFKTRSNILGQRGFAETGRAIEQNVIEASAIGSARSDVLTRLLDVAASVAAYEAKRVDI